MTSRQIVKSRGLKQGGFTLIELIVVIVLIGLMFTFALPKMDGFLFSSETDRVSRWIVLNIPNLKTKAVKDQRRYSLNVDVAANTLYISTDEMDDDLLNQARESGFKLGDSVHLVDVVFPVVNPEDEEISNVFFYSKGYSDNAIIHIENENSEKISFIIEPFLSGVEIKDGFVLFEN